MDCCGPSVYDDTFDAKMAKDRLDDYRRNGPRGSTVRLIDGLAANGVDGRSVLDIGAGVGAVHQSLLERGAATAVDVDASGPFLEAARSEAERRGLVDRVTYRKGDAVTLADDLPDADLVALDRVVCCYPHMEALVGLAASRTRERLGLVLPRDDWWVRAGIATENAFARLTRNPFRVFVHPTADVVAVAAGHGLVPAGAHRGGVWQTLLFARPARA